MGDLVSVVITSFNSIGEYLEEAIESVLNQTYQNLELIVIDDGSNNDVCKEVCMKLTNERLKYIRQDNKGLPSARNYGIQLASGKYVCFLDDDDRWDRDKLKILVNEFREIEKLDANIGLIFSYCNLIDEQGTLIGTFGNNVKGEIYKSLLGKNIIGPPSSVMIKRQVFYEIGNFNEGYRYAEDIELWYRLTQRYTVYSINKPLTDYRYRSNSLSKNSSKMMEYAEKALLLTLQNNIKVLDEFEKEKALSKFYKDFAFLFFSDNNPTLYRRCFNKAVKVSVKNVFTPKLLFGFFISLFGSKLIKAVNNLRGRSNGFPNDLTNIHESTFNDG